MGKNTVSITENNKSFIFSLDKVLWMEYNSVAQYCKVVFPHGQLSFYFTPAELVYKQYEKYLNAR